MKIDAEAVARYPAPGTNVPTGAAFSASGSWLAFMWSPEHSLRRELFVVNTETHERRSVLGAAGGVSEDNLSLEERLRRERARELGQGVTSFAWAKHRDRLLVPRPDGLHLLDAPDFVDRLAVAADGATLLDPQLSPDGALAAFIVDDELCVADLETGAWRAVTSGARGAGRVNGLAEFVAQEEMGRSHGFWWSPDGARLAFTEVDETDIPVYRIVHQASDRPGEDAQEDHRYPFAGAGNARVRLGFVPAAGGDITWAELGDGWEYLARVDWLTASEVVAQLENRDQTRLDVVAVDAGSGARRDVLVEESPVWINLHDVLRPLDGGASFLWASERTGYRHLEVRSGVDGSLERVLTDGEWIVERVAGCSDTTVWFAGTRDGPLQRHLYSVPLEGGAIDVVTTAPGTHGVVVDAEHGRFVDLHSSLSQPPRATLRDLHGGAEPVEILAGKAPDPRLDLDLSPPEVRTVTTPDGETLHVLLYRPDGDAPFPTVVSVYGGPHVQQVVDAWGPSAAMRRQWHRSLGYLVVVTDNRGSAGRGLAFEGVVKGRLGDVEVADQAHVVKVLAAEGLVDLTRVAISGWSYGGYLSALCLAREPDVFQVAVAGAPVTAWDGYDTHYTERYLGTPWDNPEGYDRSQVMAHLEGLRDRALLIVHGLIDENVHFRHSARLINAMNKARIPYELLLLPSERHSPRAEADRVYMEERIRGFLDAHL